MAGDRQQSLDVVRGIAILLVLVFHLQQPTGIGFVDAALHPLAVAGWAGVDLFFVLSGFLVGRIILTEAERPDGLDYRRFFTRRALRLWPVLYLYLATLLLTGGAAAWAMVWPVVVHAQNYASGVPSHLWSLAVEEHFYLGAALLLPWLLRGGGPRRVATVLAALIVGCGLLRIGVLALGETIRHAQWQTQYRIDAPAAGVLLALVQRHHPALFSNIARRRLAGIAIAVAGFAWLATTREDATRYGIGLTVAWVASAALVVAASAATVPRRLRPLAGAVAWLGTIAYSLYIWHASVAQLAATAAPALGIVAPGAVLTLKLAATIGVAALVHRWVERPFMALRRRQPGAPPATTVLAL